MAPQLPLPEDVQGQPCLKQLPKADLHLHLEGAMRPVTLADLARTYGHPAPQIAPCYDSFDRFQNCYQEVVELIRTRCDLQRLVHEVVEDAAASGAVWIEPHFMLSTYAPALGPAEEVLDLVLETGNATGARLGVGFGLVLGASRNRDPHQAMVLARLAAEYADRGVVAFGLVGDESAAPAEDFERPFTIAREADLILAPHAGERVGALSVRNAVDVLSADRIAHGVRAVEHPPLLERLADEGITLDVCLTSNQLLGVVDDLDDHPLPRLLKAGVPCSLGSDDPLLFGTSLLTEYQIARSQLSSPDSQLATLASTSIDASGVPDDLVMSALTGIRTWLQEGTSSSHR
ncbi:adenosine deaminase [Streptomonospora halophila]|uniref:Adenosine deaminase n=1 Tax=Streptomonospora halophila TaxID=427369 RepID=A0ABP9GHU7_9ACTN